MSGKYVRSPSSHGVCALHGDVGRDEAPPAVPMGQEAKPPGWMLQTTSDKFSIAFDFTACYPRPTEMSKLQRHEIEALLDDAFDLSDMPSIAER